MNINKSRRPLNDEPFGNGPPSCNSIKDFSVVLQHMNVSLTCVLHFLHVLFEIVPFCIYSNQQTNDLLQVQHGFINTALTQKTVNGIDIIKRCESLSMLLCHLVDKTDFFLSFFGVSNTGGPCCCDCCAQNQNQNTLIVP